MISVEAFVIATALFVALNFAIGLWKLKSDSFASYISYRNSMGALPLALSIVGTVAGGGMFFAVTEMGYDGGLSVFCLPIATSLGLLAMLVLTPRLRGLCESHNCATMFELISARFTPSKCQVAFSATITIAYFILYFFLLAGQILVLSTFIQYIIDFAQVHSLLIAAAIVFLNCLVYGVIGGLKKDIFTDIFQVVVIFLVLVVFVLVLDPPLYALGTERRDPPESDDFGLVFVVGVLLFFSPAFLIRYDLWQRMLAAKNVASFRAALVISIPLSVLVYAFFILLGILSRNTLPPTDNPTLVLLHLVDAQPAGAIAIVVLLGLFCAVLSSSDTFLNISTVSALQLFGKTVQQSTRRRDLAIARAVSLAVAVSAVGVTLLASDIVDLLVGAFSSLVMLVPSLLYVLLSRSPKAAWALCATAVPIIVFLVCFFAFPDLRTIAFVPGFLLGGVIILIRLAANRMGKSHNTRTV